MADKKPEVVRDLQTRFGSIYGPEAAFDRVIAMPIQPRLTEDDLDYMASAIASLGRS